MRFTDGIQRINKFVRPTNQVALVQLARLFRASVYKPTVATASQCDTWSIALNHYSPLSLCNISYGQSRVFSQDRSWTMTDPLLFSLPHPIKHLSKIYPTCFRTQFANHPPKYQPFVFISFIALSSEFVISCSSFNFLFLSSFPDLSTTILKFQIQLLKSSTWS